MLRYINIIKEQYYPWRFLLSRVLRDSGLWRLYNIDRDGYVLKLHPSSLSMSLWVNRNERSNDSILIRSLLRTGDTYVDIGANIGHLAIEAAITVGNNGKVIAIEAHPRTAQFLRDNIKLNKLSNILVGQFAVGNEFGWANFSDLKSDDQNKVAKNGEGLTVPIMRMEYFLQKEKVHLLKVDVEGYEKLVLDGLGEAIKNIDIIYFESFDQHYEAVGYKFSDIYNILDKNGFKIASIAQGKLIKILRDHTSLLCENLLAFRNEGYVIERLCESNLITGRCDLPQ